MNDDDQMIIIGDYEMIMGMIIIDNDDQMTMKYHLILIIDIVCSVERTTDFSVATELIFCSVEKSENRI